MTYNIFDRVAPAMPKPSKVTEIIKLLLSQTSKDMHEPLVPMLFLPWEPMWVVLNFSILTSVGRDFVAKWHT